MDIYSLDFFCFNSKIFNYTCRTFILIKGSLKGIITALKGI